MSSICLYHHEGTAYLCPLPKDHSERHASQSAVVIARELNDQLDGLTLTSAERDALSKAIHFRIPQLQAAIRQPDAQNRAVSYATVQLDTLMSVITRLNL